MCVYLSMCVVWFYLVFLGVYVFICMFMCMWCLKVCLCLRSCAFAFACAYQGRILSIILYTWPGRCRYLPSSLPAVVVNDPNTHTYKRTKTTIYKPVNN